MFFQLTEDNKKHICYLPALTEATQAFLKARFTGKDMTKIKIRELFSTDILFWFDANGKRYSSLVVEQNALLQRKNSPPIFLAVEVCTA
jgi:hypothetical protein